MFASKDLRFSLLTNLRGIGLSMYDFRSLHEGWDARVKPISSRPMFKARTEELSFFHSRVFATFEGVVRKRVSRFELAIIFLRSAFHTRSALMF